MENNIAHELGKRSQQEGVEDCRPFEDETFVAYIDKHDPPIVMTLESYVKGFYASHEEAKARRAEFKVVSND